MTIKRVNQAVNAIAAGVQLFSEGVQLFSDLKELFSNFKANVRRNNTDVFAQVFLENTAIPLELNSPDLHCTTNNT